MNLQSTLFASVALLASLSAQEAVGVGVPVDPSAVPGSIVIERGSDRIVIGWNGNVPNITVNGSKVAAPKKGAKRRLPTVIDGYKVHQPVAVGRPLPKLAKGFDLGAEYARDLSVPLAYHYAPKGADARQAWAYTLMQPDADQQTRPYIGVQVGSVPAPLVDHLGLDAKQCVLILSVTKDGPSQAAGLRKNDILLGVDGGAAVTDETLRAAVGKKQVGDRMSLRILRRGKEREIDVKVGERKSATGRYWGTVVDPKTLNGYWDSSLLPKGNLARPRWDATFDQLATGVDYKPAMASGVQKELAAIKKQLQELKKLVAELKR